MKLCKEDMQIVDEAINKVEIEPNNEPKNKWLLVEDLRQELGLDEVKND